MRHPLCSTLNVLGCAKLGHLTLVLKRRYSTSTRALRRPHPSKASQPRYPSSSSLASPTRHTVLPAVRNELSSEELDALLALSLALYEDEALATAATASVSASADVSSRDGQAALCESRTQAGSTLLSGDDTNGRVWRPLHDGAAVASPVDAYASIDPNDLMDIMSEVSVESPAIEQDATQAANTNVREGARTGSHHRRSSSSGIREHSEASRPQGGLAEKGGCSGSSSPRAAASTMCLRTTAALTMKAPANQTDGMVTPLSSTSRTAATALTSEATATALTNLLSSDEAPLEKKVMALLDAVSRHGTSSSRSRRGDQRRGTAAFSSASSDAAAISSVFANASALLLPGLDMKAVLAHGELAGRQLRNLSLPRCDFSHVRWAEVTVEDCDFARSIFYQATWHNVLFRRCNFTGCLMKEVRCTGRVRVEDCAFRLAAVGLQYSTEADAAADTDDDHRAPHQHHHVPGDRRNRSHVETGVRFVRCDFDLSDFQFSRGLTNPTTFAQCSNTHLASKFPLRMRGGVS